MAYDVGRAQGEIVINYKGDGVKDARRDIDGLQKSSKNIGPQLDRVGTGMAKAGAAIGVGFGLAIKSAVDFESRMSAVKAVSGASAQEMDSLTKKALQLGKDTKFSATEAASAIEELVKAGVSVPDVMNGAADATVALAAAGEIELPQAAEIAANAMNAFGLSAQQMPKIADAIAGAANASAIDVSQFGQSLSQVGAVANLAGVSFEDTATAIALMGNAGIKGSDAGTSLKTMLQNLQPSTKKQSELFKELGLITEDGSNKFYDAQGNLKSFDQVAQVLQDSLKGMTKQQKQMALETLFGSDAIRAAAIVADSGAAGFDKMTTAMGKVSAADVAAARMDNFKGSLEQTLGALETVGITIGQIFLPTLRSIVDSVGRVLDKFLELPPGVQQTIVAIAAGSGAFLLLGGILLKVIAALSGVGATLGPILAVMGGAAARVFGPFVSGFASSAAAASAFSGVMGTLGGVVRTALSALLGPVGIVIGVITALAAAAVFAYNNFEPFKNLVDGIARAIQGTFLAALEGAKTALDAVVQGFNGVTSATGALGFFQQIGAALRELWTAFQQLGAQIQDVFINQVLPEFQKAWEQLQPAITELTVALQPLVDAFINQFLPAMAQVNAVLLPFIGSVLKVAALIVGAWLLGMIKMATFIVGTVLPAVVAFAGALTGGLIAAITSVVVFITNLITTILTFVAQLTTTVMTGIQTFVTGVQTIFNGLVAFFTTLWTTITTIFTTAVTAIATFFTTAWNGLATIVTTVLTAIQTVISTITAAIGVIWNAFWNSAIGQTVANAMGLIGDLINLGMKAAQFVIISALGVIRAIWTSVWNAIKTIVTTVWNAIKTAVTAAVNAVRSVVTTVVNAIKAFMSAAWNSIKTVVSTVWNAIKTVITTVINAIKSVVTTVINAIKSFLSSAWNGIKSTAQSVWNGIKSLITSAINGIKNTINNVMNSIKSLITGAWNSMNSSTNGAFSKFVSTISSKVNSAMDTIRGIKDKVIGALSGAASWLVNAGRNVIQGFLNGINSMIGTVRSKLQELTSMIPDLKGPPKKDKILLEENGRLIMKGLIAGIASQVGNLENVLGNLTVTIPSMTGVNTEPIFIPRAPGDPKDPPMATGASGSDRPTIQQDIKIYNPVRREDSLEINDELQRAAAFVGV